MKNLLKYLKGYRLVTVLAPLCKMIEASFELIIPLLIAYMVDTIIPNGDTAGVYQYGGIILGLGALGLMFSITCQYCAAKSSHFFGANVRSALYQHINRLGFSELDYFGADSLTTRLSNDVNNLQVGLAMFMRLVTRSPFIVIGSIILSISISPSLSIIFIIASVLIGIVLYVVMTKSSKLYTKIQNQLDGVALLVNENLTGTRVVRAFSRQEQENDDFDKTTTQLAKTAKKSGIISGLMSPLTYVIINFAIIFVLWYGGIDVSYGNLAQGEVLALYNYLTQIFLSLVVLALLVVTFTKATASAKRINEVLKTEPALTFDNTDTTLDTVDSSSNISFDNVSFCYPQSCGCSLENINIEILRGQTIGIIGATGSGKTTIANLICRFYDTTSGQVKIDGHDVKAYSKNQLFSKVAIVLQKSVLFYGTVRENILWGNPSATDEEIMEALTIARADEVVNSMPCGLDSMIMAGGKNLSGGQRQRLTIARAVVKNPDILILDDSSSALDYATDAQLRKNLKTKLSSTTVIMISQRASSIKNADQILVLDEGKSVGLGTHNSLLSDCEVYQEICLSQENIKEKNTKKSTTKGAL